MLCFYFLFITIKNVSKVSQIYLLLFNSQFRFNLDLCVVYMTRFFFCHCLLKNIFLISLYINVQLIVICRGWTEVDQSFGKWRGSKRQTSSDDFENFAKIFVPQCRNVE